jgi:hypothetical protein
MDKTYKDTDLREALRRQYSDTPQLPADFMAKMEKRLDAKPVAKTRSLWSWMAATACILLIIGIGFTMWPQNGQPTEPMLAQTTEQPKQEASKEEQEREVQKESEEKQQYVANPVRTGRTVSTKRTHQEYERDVLKATPRDAEPQGDPNIHYAANELTKDTVPYQDPARVDDYIYQLAANHQVKQGGLTCSQPADSSVVSAVYVFPDKDEINLFGRLLQVACWYDSKTPGYHLNFSQQQFFFELKDTRKQLQYRWIAERINGRILFYSTHAPIGAKESSACYQQYRDELMYQNSINIKNKEI